MRDWVIDDGIYQPNRQRLIRVHHFRQQKHLHGPRFADQTRQALGAAQSGQDAQAGAAMSKDSIRRGDAIVTSQRQIHACAHTISANRGDHRNEKPVNREREGLTRAGELKGLRRAEPPDLIQVGPQPKRIFRSL